MNKNNRKHLNDKQRQRPVKHSIKEYDNSVSDKPIPEIYVNASFQLNGDDLVCYRSISYDVH